MLRNELPLNDTHFPPLSLPETQIKNQSNKERVKHQHTPVEIDGGMILHGDQTGNDPDHPGEDGTSPHGERGIACAFDGGDIEHLNAVAESEHGNKENKRPRQLHGGDLGEIAGTDKEREERTGTERENNRHNRHISHHQEPPVCDGALGRGGESGTD